MQKRCDIGENNTNPWEKRGKSWGFDCKKNEVKCNRDAKKRRPTKNTGVFCSVFFLHFDCIKSFSDASRRRGAVRSRKGSRMLYHKCRCGILIPQGIARCKACEERKQKYDKEREKERQKIYSRYRRDKKKAAFYVSPVWRKKRAEILALHDYIDIYAFYVQKRIMTADMVHHIVPLEDDWSRRLDAGNLIPLSNQNHGIIEAMYKDETKKQELQQLLFELKAQHQKAGGV